jgi:hypothetical protein
MIASFGADQRAMFDAATAPKPTGRPPRFGAFRAGGHDRPARTAVAGDSRPTEPCASRRSGSTSRQLPPAEPAIAVPDTRPNAAS